MEIKISRFVREYGDYYVRFFVTSKDKTFETEAMVSGSEAAGKSHDEISALALIKVKPNIDYNMSQPDELPSEDIGDMIGKEVKVAPAALQSIRVLGPASVFTTAAGPVSSNFNAVPIDQYGSIIESSAVVWSYSPSEPGIEIDASTGRLTANRPDLAASVVVTISAAIGGVVGTLQVAVNPPTGEDVLGRKVAELETESVQTMLAVAEAYETAVVNNTQREKEGVDTMLRLTEVYDLFLQQQVEIEALKAEVSTLRGC
ncbi:hypothetical protein [Cohnella nanjingensis]|uniref:Uncharacterized protein n=1 Tax=Cohnella nanjingensis TaxID=1387779 RepID=A0A7X0RQA1_9BACL|nr:hypothetical protein [Cohnella nanjingensis]MBB6670516.1 hypothetical protein [Cohnella nanjingensis]